MRAGSRVSRRAAAGALVVVCLAAAAAAVSPSSARAQDRTREVQVPVDSAGSLLEIGPGLRGELGVLPTVPPGFVHARLFSLDDGRTVLEVTSLEEGRLVRERTVLTPAALADLRAAVEAGLAARGRVAVHTREGRGGLVLGHTLLALGFHGWAVPVALDVDNKRGAVAAYLLTAGAGFYLPYRLTRNAPVSDAHRNLTLWGATRGIAYGLTLGDVLDPGDSDSAGRVRVGTALGTSVLGSFLGYHAVQRSGASEGTADLWGALGDLGLASGFGLAYVLGLYDTETRDRERRDGDLIFTEDVRPRKRAGHAVALSAGAGSLVLARWLGGRESYTVGDVHVLRSMALLGAQVGLPLVSALDDEDEFDKPYVVAMLAGGAAGLVVGNRLLRREDFSGGDGLLVAAGHLAGGVAGLGVAYLLDNRSERSSFPYLTASALGSAAGLALTYRALSGRRGGPPGGSR